MQSHSRLGIVIILSMLLGPAHFLEKDINFGLESREMLPNDIPHAVETHAQVIMD